MRYGVGRRSYWSGLTGDAEATNNTIVMACTGWAMRSFVEPPLVVDTERPDGKTQRVPGHALAELLRAPQSGLAEPSKMSGRRLLAATVYSRLLDGNAYWHLIKNGSGRVIGLDYIPHFACEPLSEAGRPNVLRAYHLMNGGRWTEVPPDDIFHSMDGIDPENPLKGLSPLKAAMRQVMTDNQAAVYSAAIIKSPTPSFAIIPKGETAPTQDQADYIALKMSEAAGAGKQGSVIVPTFHSEIQKLNYSPEDLALDKMLRVPEERISACFGIPAIVAGLGAGLERSTFSNFKEAREAATEQFLVPMWASIADDINIQVLPLVGAQPGEYACFDISKVRILQEDQDNLWQRGINAYAEGGIKRSEFKSMVGLDYGPEDEIYKTDLELGGSTDAAKKAALSQLKQKLTAKQRREREVYESIQSAN